MFSFTLQPDLKPNKKIGFEMISAQFSIKLTTHEMSSQSILMNFTIEAVRLNNSDSRKSIRETIEIILQSTLEMKLEIICDVEVADGNLTIFKNSSSVIITLRIFNNGLLTVNVEFNDDNFSLKNSSFSVNLSLSDNFYSV